MNSLAAAGLFMRELPPQFGPPSNIPIRVYGGIIKNMDTGRIVGHLQEARPITQLLSNGVVGLPMQAGQLIQGEMIRSGVKRVEAGVHLLQNLTAAGLALDVVGIGVNIIGFKIMADKLDRVQGTLHAMADTLDTISAKIDGLRQDRIDADFVALHSMTRLHEEGWDFGDRGRSEQQWLRVAQDARTLQDRFAWRARDLLAGSMANFALADGMIDALALSSGLRVTSLVACNENVLARSVAAEAASQIEALTGSIGLLDLVARHMPPDPLPGTSEFGDALEAARDAAAPVLRKLRDREAATATRAAPLALLEKHGIAPRKWLEAARSETESPFLILKDDEREAQAA